MTRFLLNLNQAVDTVFEAVKTAYPGETYVPNAPAATILNIAKALIGERQVDIKITGIRPGEKMHEIMVSDEEAFRTLACGDYYAIKPMLPELNGRVRPGCAALAKEFSSNDNVLDFEGTVKLLKQNKLRLQDIGPMDNQELLR
jgi:UDP-glucose 4-epimerase